MDGPRHGVRRDGYGYSGGYDGSYGHGYAQAGRAYRDRYASSPSGAATPVWRSPSPYYRQRTEGYPYCGGGDRY